jgi:hypothetical protein
MECPERQYECMAKHSGTPDIISKPSTGFPIPSTHTQIKHPYTEMVKELVIHPANGTRKALF